MNCTSVGMIALDILRLYAHLEIELTAPFMAQCFLLNINYFKHVTPLGLIEWQKIKSHAVSSSRHL